MKTSIVLKCSVYLFILCTLHGCWTSFISAEKLLTARPLYSSYDTKLAILTYNEILTLLTVLYSTLYIYITATCTTYNTDYIRYKNQIIKGAGKYGKF